MGVKGYRVGGWGECFNNFKFVNAGQIVMLFGKFKYMLF